MKSTKSYVALLSSIAVATGFVSAQQATTTITRPKVAKIELEDPVRLKVGDDFIDTVGEIGHAGPNERDLDGDGKLDLIVGNFKGHFQIYRNVGSAREPAYESRGMLQAGGAAASIHNW